MDTTWWLQLEDLDDAQREIIALDTEINSLVIGPPGSGKTNLLLLRASFLERSGQKNFCVLTLNRWLSEFLSIGADNYEVPPGKIMTYIKWAKDLLAENGIKIGDSSDFESLRKQVYEGLEQVAKKNDDFCKYDYLLIDEVQDYTSEEINILRKFSRFIYAVGDSKQRIYIADDTIEKIRSLFDSCIQLRYHYRNGIQICRLADGIANQINKPFGMEATSHYREDKLPSTVKVFPGITIEDQVHATLDAIQDQLLAYPLENIGVFVPRRSDLSDVIDYLKRSNISDQCIFQGEEDVPRLVRGKRIFVGTVHSTKGMEFRACHFLLADNIKKFETQKKMAYTACTRAKTSLSIYHHDSLPGYFGKGISHISPTHTIPTLESLFPLGRKK